jgi:hypothetical protein
MSCLYSSNQCCAVGSAIHVLSQHPFAKHHRWNQSALPSPLTVQHPPQPPQESLPKICSRLLHRKRPIAMRHTTHNFPLNKQTRLRLQHPPVVVHAIFLAIDDPSKREAFDAFHPYTYRAPMFGLVVVRRILDADQFLCV